MLAGQEAAVPHLRAGVGQVLGQDHVGRQVGVERAEPVAEPGAEARQRHGGRAGVHGEGCLEMLDDVGVQRADHAQLVGHLAQPHEEIADGQPGSARGLELEAGPQQGQGFGLVGPQAEGRDRLAVAPPQLELGIEGVDMREPAGQEHHHQLGGLGPEPGGLGPQELRVAQGRGLRPEAGMGECEASPAAGGQEGASGQPSRHGGIRWRSGTRAPAGSTGRRRRARGPGLATGPRAAG